MHILWTIIKVLGLILLWLLVILLSLLLLAVLSVVFAPVRYDIQAQGSTRDGTYDGTGTVWWLLHLVHVTASAGKDGQRFGIYVLGIPLHRILAGRKNRQQKKQKELAVAEMPSDHADPEPDSAGEGSRGSAPGRELGEDEEGTQEMPADENIVPADDIPAEDTDPDPPGRMERLADRIREGYDSLRRGIRQTAGNVRAVYERAGSARETAAWYIRLWNEGTTVAARKLMGGELRCLLRHWKPRRVEGNVVFGLGDPANTGFALALLALVYPASNGRLAISPDFDRVILEGRLHVRGHMRVFWPLKSGIRLFIAPEIRATYHKWQTRKDG